MFPEHNPLSVVGIMSTTFQRVVLFPYSSKLGGRGNTYTIKPTNRSFFLFLFFLSENSTVNTGLLYNTHSWLPMHIRIELLRKGGVNIRKIPPMDSEPPDGVSIKE
jgi:hypothetical protein